MPLAKLRALAAHLGFALPADFKSESEQRAALEQCFHFAGVEVAGIAPAKVIIPRTGLDRAVQSKCQAKADSFLKHH